MLLIGHLPAATLYAVLVTALALEACFWPQEAPLKRTCNHWGRRSCYRLFSWSDALLPATVSLDSCKLAGCTAEGKPGFLRPCVISWRHDSLQMACSEDLKHISHFLWSWRRKSSIQPFRNNPVKLHSLGVHVTNRTKAWMILGVLASNSILNLCACTCLSFITSKSSHTA